MNLEEARGKVESITTTTTTAPPTQIEAQIHTRAAQNAWVAASISLMQGVCPDCGEKVTVSERFNKFYYQCVKDTFHFYMRDSVVSSD